jgi:flagellar basal-body rod modification protein FlgD
MEFSTLLAPQQKLDVQRNVEAFNKSLGHSATLDREDFLKILITQLTHQDPTQPMEDREFISQMAQFSTLEQMVNMGHDVGRVSGIIAKSQALALLGHTVTLADGDKKVTGKVEQVEGREVPRILVNGKLYDFSTVETVSAE